MEGMCFVDVSSAIHIKVKSVKTIQKSPFQKSIVTHHCSFHSLRTVAESFAHSIPAFFLVIPKRFPSHFGRQSFTSIKTTSQNWKIITLPPIIWKSKKWVPSNSTHMSKYSRFSTKNHDCGRKKAQNRGKRKGRFQKVDFFHAEKGADKSLSSMYSLSSVAHWSATSGQSQPKFREKKLRLYFI